MLSTYAYLLGSSAKEVCPLPSSDPGYLCACRGPRPTMQLACSLAMEFPLILHRSSSPCAVHYAQLYSLHSLAGQVHHQQLLQQATHLHPVQLNKQLPQHLRLQLLLHQLEPQQATAMHPAMGQAPQQQAQQ